MNRREFGYGAGAALVMAAQARGSAAAATPTLYYMDGWHGGARGHMPLGCWRDIMEAMKARPDWKLSLDVESPSWEILKREDPDAFERLWSYVENRDGQQRVEITGGTFCQPYGWAITGESNIRQMQRGLELIHQQFGTARVETYAVQEPCWASCMPQILRSLGFTGASLKNASTAWGGYTQGFDAELVNWIGPDGTQILAVPRYQCEALLNTWETEATEVTPAYAVKCVEHRIPEPVGMCFQDLGWAAQPRANAAWIRNAIWREYIHEIARAKPVDWKFTMEDILTALPWGEKTLQRSSQQVRAAEVRLVAAEKFAAMSFLESGSAWPGERLQQVWDQMMWSQAHDAWITVTTRTGRQAWAFQVAAETMDAEQTADALVDEAMDSLSAEKNTQPTGEMDVQYLRTVNVLGQEREDLVEIVVPADRGTQGFEVKDARGEVVPCQFTTTRRYRRLRQTEGANTPVIGNGRGTGDESGTSINAAALLFKGKLPAYGWSTYEVRSMPDAAPAANPAGGVRATTESDGSVTVESDLYRIRFDAGRGGAISTLYCKSLAKEFCAQDKLLNEFRGYFITPQKWCSSADSPAQIEVQEAGPLRVTLRISGAVGGSKFRSTAAIVQGQTRIDFHTAIQFDEDTWIGDPWDIKPEDRRTERRRSCYDGRWKLQALFPVALEDCAMYKNSAFDVCLSRNASTHFQRWDEIKHNIIMNWVDIFDAKQKLGLALFSDRTTAYSFGDGDPLGLILAWGGEAGFWWGKCPLRGEQESSYSIVPHRGLWTEAGLWHENARAEEPIVAQWMESPAHEMARERSFLRLSPTEATLSAVRVEGAHLEVRIFHARERAGEVTLRFGFPVAQAELVELDGRTAARLAVQRDANGGPTVQIQIAPFGLRTVRATRASG